LVYGDDLPSSCRNLKELATLRKVKPGAIRGCSRFFLSVRGDLYRADHSGRRQHRPHDKRKRTQAHEGADAEAKPSPALGRWDASPACRSRARCRLSYGAGWRGSYARKGPGRGRQTFRVEVPLQSLQIAPQLSRTLGPQIAILLQCLVDHSFQREWRGRIQTGDGCRAEARQKSVPGSCHRKAHGLSSFRRAQCQG
jgi:hypothetical protein